MPVLRNLSQAQIGNIPDGQPGNIMRPYIDSARGNASKTAQRFRQFLLSVAIYPCNTQYLSRFEI